MGMLTIALFEKFGNKGFVATIEDTNLRRCTSETSKLRYICSAQSENQYNSGIVLSKVGILTLSGEVGILAVQYRHCSCAKWELGQSENTCNRISK